MYKYSSNNVGEFTEVDYGCSFTYRKTTDAWALKHNFEYEVDVGYDTRFARISKSRCHMVIDEAADGKPVVECWKIRKHVTYSSQ